MIISSIAAVIVVAIYVGVKSRVTKPISQKMGQKVEILFLVLEFAQRVKV